MANNTPYSNADTASLDTTELNPADNGGIMLGSQLLPSTSRNSQNHLVTMVLWGLITLIVLGIIAVMTGVISFTSNEDHAGGMLRKNDRDNTWSYYHDTKYDSSTEGAKWSTDRTRSRDPDESVLGDTTRWEYDGPYRYGPYGSDGMRRRMMGKESRDPLYSQPAPLQDVFLQFGGDLDPSGGKPVGVAPSSMTTPYFDPYAGYSNPYANRIRMSYGEGIGRGASYDPMG